MDAPCQGVHECSAMTQELVLNLNLFKTMLGACAFVAVEVGAIGLVVWVAWRECRKLTNNGVGK